MAASVSRRLVKNHRLSFTKSKFSVTEYLNSVSYSNSKLSTNKINSFEYCVNSVRKHDYENYLCTLLLPENVRSPVFVIRAFNVELAQVRDLVSSPAIGYMRIQFWKDSLEQIYKGQPPAQPIAVELAEILRTHKLSKMWFNRLISCREDIMSDKGFLTISELEDYCEQSVASVYYLTLQAMGLQNIHCDHAASHLGKCQGICNLLRGIPFNASRGRVYLPMELMSKHNLSEESVIHGKQRELLTEVVFELASVAHQHLELARSFRKDIPKHAWPAFLPAVAVDAFLKSLQKCGFNILNPKHQLRNNWLPISLLFYKIRKQY